MTVVLHPYSPPSHWIKRLSSDKSLIRRNDWALGVGRYVLLLLCHVESYSPPRSVKAWPNRWGSGVVNGTGNRERYSVLHARNWYT